jgi:hypothetical protein
MGFGKAVEFNDKITTIYLSENETVDEWVQSDIFMSVLFGSLMKAAAQLIYTTNKSKIHIANVVSIEFEPFEDYTAAQTMNTEVYLTKENLSERLEQMLEYSLAWEEYMDCATIRDMITDYGR